jgi:hypothetical protein
MASELTSVGRRVGVVVEVDVVVVVVESNAWPSNEPNFARTLASNSENDGSGIVVC